MSSHTDSASPSKRTKRRRGIALILVLAALLMIGAIVLSFLSSVTNDARSSAVFSEDARAKQLSETVTNLVMGQIIEATKGGNSSNTLAWASQPGAIRTYNSNGSAAQIFKLYSSPTMVGNGTLNLSDDLPTSADEAAIASGKHPIFTDLNAPVVDGGNQTVFPIADPAAINAVQGFRATSNASIGVTVSGNSTTPTDPSRRLPMPARWLYMLKDGTLVSASGDATIATMPSNSDPDYYKKNPIVGRVAFWTDDETSKVNINTASGAPWNYGNTTVTTTEWAGTLTTRNPANFWDTPIIGSPQDVNLALSQPQQREFQRYPGHPATISLSAALPGLVTQQNIQAIAPRVVAGGSEGGSKIYVNLKTTGNQTAPPINLDSDRLYASLDELLFTANRTFNNEITAPALRQSAFFLTASSRAPEVTLFNTPRIVMWPIHTQASKRTAYDKLIAFCGTVGPNKTIGGNNSYYFTRTNPDSATVDYNITRNQQLLSYLRTLTTKAVPGFGGSSGILGKYGADTEQITTQIFDYIRCTNSQDTSTQSTSFVTSNATNSATFYAPNGMIMPTAGANNTRGFGRFPTVTKAGIIFWFNGNATTANATTGGNDTKGVTLCARLLLESFVASHGHPNPTSSPSLGMKYRVSGLSGLRWGENSTVTRPIFNIDPANIVPGGNGRPHGGRWSVTRIGNMNLTNNSTLLTSLPTSSNPPPYGFTAPPTTGTDNRTLYFGGGNLTIEVMGPGTSTYVNQVININLPAVTLPFPTDTTLRPPAGNTTYNMHSSWGGTWATANTGRFSHYNFVFRPQDAVRSVGVTHGDFRLVAANPNVPSTVFSPVNDYGNSTIRVRHNFVEEYPYTMLGATFPAQNYHNTSNASFVDFPVDAIYSFDPNTPNNAVRLDNSRKLPLDGFSAGFHWINGDAVQHGNSTYGPGMAAAVTGDFDNGYGAAGDGPYIGFADEGNSRLFMTSYGSQGIPYLDGSGEAFSLSGAFYSPNRLVPSAGIMGSLPTGVLSQTPWQTLLFRPAALTSASHRGLNSPPDYLLFDLFNMPVVEPYAISEPLSTAGRVNMNYQILPFTYIKRSTAVQAALHTEWLTAIPNSQINAQNRKTGGTTSSTARNSRWPLNLSETLKGFEDRFDNNDIFRSPAEICSIPLVPSNSTWTAVTSNSSTGFWPNHSLTGDNSKERPYARIYPKLTTKSNSFTVHFRVQVLKKNPNTQANQWVEGRDNVSSEYRGSTLIERYIDPNDTRLPDFATNTSANIDDYYRFRVIQTRKFAP